ncbi:MAG: endonuclease/exonuclease/phosphatase family protein [Proteobacteria bacterium]|nr:endonuclease/exonuclease/phosphatase family protein [Pseudomonadota bacterium]
MARRTSRGRNRGKGRDGSRPRRHRAKSGIARARAIASRARDAQRKVTARVRERRDARAAQLALLPHLSLVRAPTAPMTLAVMGPELSVATYNVHRWTGLNGRAAPDPARAGFVISELEADVIALQEVLRPSGAATAGAANDDPLVDLCDTLGLHLAFAVTREHKRGQLGNAILSRFPIAATSVLDISHSRIERRGALAVQFNGENGSLGIVATHLSLVDRTRQKQVESLLDHPQLHAGPTVLLGDMNAWRKCKATRSLDETLHVHHNQKWPASFPSAKPVLALDRIYARGAQVIEVTVHDTPAARRASDHLPVVARIALASRASER